MGVGLSDAPSVSIMVPGLDWRIMLPGVGLKAFREPLNEFAEVLVGFLRLLCFIVPRKFDFEVRASK